jgi:hypothetical protein
MSNHVSSANSVNHEWPIPRGVTYRVIIDGGRLLDIKDRLNGNSLAKYLADISTYPCHYVYPNETWPDADQNVVYHMISPHTEALNLYRQSLQLELSKGGVPAEKIESVVAKIFNPFSTLYKSFILNINGESARADFFFESGRADEHRMMELEKTLRNCRIVSWIGIASIIGGLSLNIVCRRKHSTAQRVGTWVGYAAIAGGLLALVYSTLKSPQYLTVYR